MQEKMVGKLNGALGFHEVTVEGNGSLFLKRKYVYNKKSDVVPANTQV